jgi:hypothetical protein
MASRIHILALDSPATTNEAQWKIEQLYELFLLPSHVPIGHQQPLNYEMQMFFCSWHAYKFWNKTNPFFSH